MGQTFLPGKRDHIFLTFFLRYPQTFLNFTFLQASTFHYDFLSCLLHSSSFQVTFFQQGGENFSTPLRFQLFLQSATPGSDLLRGHRSAFCVIALFFQNTPNIQTQDLHSLHRPIYPPHQFPIYNSGSRTLHFTHPSPLTPAQKNYTKLRICVKNNKHGKNKESQIHLDTLWVIRTQVLYKKRNQTYIAFRLFENLEVFLIKKEVY